MAEKKKRKIDYECRQFQDEWNLKYFFIKSADKALCVICHEAIAVLKEYNLRRHYQTKHQSYCSQMTGKVCPEKFAKLQHQINAQRSMFMECSNENESLTKVSYKVAYVLAKCGKPFTDGGIVKKWKLRRNCSRKNQNSSRIYLWVQILLPAVLRTCVKIY